MHFDTCILNAEIKVCKELGHTVLVPVTCENKNSLRISENTKYYQSDNSSELGLNHFYSPFL